MENNVTEIVNRFVNRWTIAEVKRMQLEDYIDFNFGAKDKSRFGSINTFCYWVEYSFWKARLIRNPIMIDGDFRFNVSFCNRYGIVSLGNESKEFNKNSNDKQDIKPEMPAFPDLIDKEGVYYEDYSSKEEINKEGFYIFDEYMWNELKNINDYGYTVYDLIKTIPNKVDLNTEYDFLNEKIFKSNLKYQWNHVLGKNQNDAFHTIKDGILEIIELSQNNDFDKLDKSILSRNFAWRIAYLYSSEKIIPIFRFRILMKCAENFGFQLTSKVNISELQRFLIEKKPTHFKNNFDYARYLLWIISPKNSENETKQKNTRKSVETKSVEQQTRKAIESYTIEQNHNLLQNKFSEKLIAYYGKNAVKLEENYVDIKLYSPETIVFYEVKSDASASVCIKNALGQVLWYVFADTDERNKRIIVVGQYPPTYQETLFIDFLKQNLQIDFEYEYIDISIPNSPYSEY